MAQSPNPIRGANRPEDDDLTSGKMEEDIAGRADDEEEQEFEDTEDIDEEEDREEERY